MPIPLDKKYFVVTLRHMEGSCFTIPPAVDEIRYLVKRRLSQGILVYLHSDVLDSLPPTSCANMIQRTALVNAINTWSLDNFKKVLPILDNDNNPSRTTISFLQRFN